MTALPYRASKIDRSFKLAFQQPTFNAVLLLAGMVAAILCANGTSSAFAANSAVPRHHARTIYDGRLSPKSSPSKVSDMLAPHLVTPDVLSGSVWTSVGPSSIYLGSPGYNYAGRITAVVADPKVANTIYVAGAGGGVWKTTDGGSSWTPLTDGMPWQAMGALAIDPENSQTIYAGTGEPNNSGDSQYGIGIYKSTNGGTSWTLIPPASESNPFFRKTISKIIVDPSSSNTIYVSVCSFGVNGLYGGGGVWKTTDGGNTWTNTTSATLNTGAQVSDMVMDPTNHLTLYAADGVLYGDAENGIYKTTNGGSTWALAGTTPSGTAVGRFSLGISNSTPPVIYTGIQNPSTYGLFGVYKSTDSGATWTNLPNCPDYMGTQGWYDQFVAVSPKNPNIVYVAGVTTYSTPSDAILESQDGGSTWTDISNDSTGNGPHTDHHGVAFDANGKLLDGNDGGIWRLDGDLPNTLTWTDINSNLCITQFTGIDLHPTDPTIALGGSQDNGTEKYTGSSLWNLSRGGDGGFVRIDQTNPMTMYHTFYYSGPSFIEKSTDGGSTWNSSGNGIGANDHVPGDNNINQSDTANFYPPYIMDPANSARLILGTDHVYETTNSASSWTPIGIPNTSGFNANDVPVDAIGVNGSTVYAAAGSSIFVSTNDGTSWIAKSIPAVQDKYSDIAVDSTNSLNLYIVRDNFNDASDTGHVFHSTDGGTTWTDITGSLGDIPTSAIKYNPSTQTIYVGCDGGVYTSSNNGASWAQLGTGLSNCQVVNLALNTTTNILAAGTHGRGMWELSIATGIASFQIAPNNVTSGTQSTGTVTLSQPAPSGGAIVTLTSSNSHDAVAASGTITIPAGSSVGKFTIYTANKGNAPVNVTLTASYAGTTATAQITVNPASVSLSSLTINPSSTTSGTATTGTVTLSGPAPTGGIVVALSSSNPKDAVSAMPTVTVPAGQTSANFTIYTANKSNSPVSITLTATYNGVSKTSSVLIYPIPPNLILSSLTVSPPSVTSGTVATGTVTITEAAPPSGIVVSLSSSKPTDAVPASPTVTIPSGMTVASFKIYTSNKGASPVTVTITATYNGVSKTAPITVNP